MTVESTVRQDYEQTLVEIARALPHKRVVQLVDFARFLEAQLLSDELTKEEDVAEIEVDNARWDALLATDESQALLEQLAGEALAEHRAGKTNPLAFNGEGRIVPG